MPTPPGFKHSPETIAKMRANGGRPKEWVKELVDVEAHELSLWSEKDSSKFLVQFCAQRNYCTENLTKWANENENFRNALKLSKLKIASRMHEGVNNGTVNYGQYMRVIGMYDDILHSYERTEKVFDAGLKDKQAENGLEGLKSVIQEINGVKPKRAAKPKAKTKTKRKI